MKTPAARYASGSQSPQATVGSTRRPGGGSPRRVRRRQYQNPVVTDAASYADIMPEARLIIAVIQQGVVDCLNGDPGALNWLNGRAFEHWCSWLDVDAGYLRRVIRGEMT